MSVILGKEAIRRRQKTPEFTSLPKKKSLMLSKNRSDPDIVSSGMVVQGVGFTLGDLLEDRSA